MKHKNQKDQKDAKRDCFGILDKVFPMTGLGLRQTPNSCYDRCSVEIKTKCLEVPMTTRNGVKLEEELIERGTRTGTINFFERWSRKKQAYKKLQKRSQHR